jgi:hypothetical protein
MEKELVSSFTERSAVESRATISRRAGWARALKTLVVLEVIRKCL